MVDLPAELLRFDYRELRVRLEELFPKLNREAVKNQFGHLKKANPHETVLNVARALWNGGYEELLREQGFYDRAYASFSGHCHQCTPELGLVLKVLGFEKVSYLECFRVREHFPETGIIEQVPPEEEPNLEMKAEFCSIRRIPYCCLEVFVNGEPFYLTGKHVKPRGEETVALLTPRCYREFVGVFAHQEDKRKSGVYLQNVLSKANPEEKDFSRQVVWMKQTMKDPAPEYFATFLRMEIV